MAMNRRAFGAGLAAAGSVALAGCGEEEAATGAGFFAGKRIGYLVATDVGGGYDTYARLIARYLERHLENAQVIVRNVPGAGHLIGTNELYADAPDGLTIGTFNTGLIYAQLGGADGVRFDLRRFSWIGKAASDPRVLITGAGRGLDSLDALRGLATPAVFASAGVGSASHLELAMIARVLDLEVRIVPGFGGADAEAAVLKGEVDGTLGSASSLWPLVEQGAAVAVLRAGTPEQAELAAAAELADAVTDPLGREVAALIATSLTMGRLTAAPPAVAADRLAALRGAYANALADPELRIDAAALGVPVDPARGEDVAERIVAVLDASPEILALIADVGRAAAP